MEEASVINVDECSDLPSRLRYIIDATHAQWSGRLLLFLDGLLVASHNGDTGTWTYTGRCLTLRWDRWPAEQMTTANGIAFRGPALFGTLQSVEQAADDAVARVSLIIPYRETHADRRANLLALLRHYDRDFPGLEKIVVEQNKTPQLDPARLPHNTRHVFTKNGGHFNRSWGFNVGAGETDRNLLLFADCDIAIPPRELAAAGDVARFFPVVKPYSRLVDVPAEHTERFRQTLDPSVLPKEGRQIIQMLCGGAVMMAREGFESVGGWCEEFEGWGAEDNAQQEKVARFLRSVQLPGCAFHLHHHRSDLDGYRHPWYRQNLAHLQRLSAMSKDELREHIRRVRPTIGRRDKYTGPGE